MEQKWIALAFLSLLLLGCIGQQPQYGNFQDQVGIALPHSGERATVYGIRSDGHNTGGFSGTGHTSNGIVNYSDFSAAGAGARKEFDYAGSDVEYGFCETEFAATKIAIICKRGDCSLLLPKNGVFPGYDTMQDNSPLTNFTICMPDGTYKMFTKNWNQNMERQDVMNEQSVETDGSGCPVDLTFTGTGC